MIYESEITVSPNAITVVTRQAVGIYSTREIIERYDYGSIDKLRDSLIREKFHVDFAGKVGPTMFALGLAVMTSVGIRRDLFNLLSAAEIIIGASSTFAGFRLDQYGRENQSKVNSRVKAFNDTFSDLKPVSFSPREYLSTVRIPFFRR